MAIKNPFSIQTFGTTQAIGALNLELGKQQLRTKRGAIKGVLIIQRASQKKVPVDEGNLRASHASVWEGGGDTRAAFTGDNAAELSGVHARVVGQVQQEVSPSIIKPEAWMVVTAPYGIYVHEDPEAKHAVGEHKFTEKAVIETQAEVVEAFITEGKKP